jgi:hypothetical protein
MLIILCYVPHNKGKIQTAMVTLPEPIKWRRESSKRFKEK